MELLSARLVAVTQETPTVRRLMLEVQDQGLVYKPGQWVDFYVRIDGIQNVAGFSLTSSPEADSRQIELAVKLSPHPVTSFLHEHARVGDVFNISQGMGPVFYDRRIGDEVVLIAGGIGITPLMSMFRTVHDHWQEVRATLIYSDNDPDEFAYGTEIRAACQGSERLKAHFTLTGSHPQVPDWIAHQGRIETAWLRDLELPELAHYFLCGPQPMLGALGAELRELDVPRACIHYEEW